MTEEKDDEEKIDIFKMGVPITASDKDRIERLESHL